MRQSLRATAAIVVSVSTAGILSMIPKTACGEPVGHYLLGA
jgi:hypothetical protein